MYSIFFYIGVVGLYQILCWYMLDTIFFVSASQLVTRIEFCGYRLKFKGNQIPVTSWFLYFWSLRIIVYCQGTSLTNWTNKIKICKGCVNECEPLKSQICSWKACEAERNVTENSAFAKLWREPPCFCQTAIIFFPPRRHGTTKFFFYHNIHGTA